MPKEGEDAFQAIPGFRELIELLKQGAHVVVSMPPSGTHRIYNIRRNASGNIEYDFETIPEP